ncbi:transmembrane protein, putative (macronuclear) [Tetrahymena thermophila SB210]|uniref:Transmembrane protein, putative n=1 Tax=Tetrahymena thermophila (strain SB210) TaxID=312017 RepID=W7XDY3_TETTS|nr:transmembrane protein, putative [Tetrahymena thermophila SB210]EWS72116.1 transmembrane protein, putative [Tetrahymena thermophila SB210]|eukprot:XP_012655350.1 transmembrane protein, putative [Tetrahymena thermophila SB210]
MYRIKYICLQLIFFIRCLNSQYDWQFILTCNCALATGANYNDQCAWITQGCSNYNLNNSASFCCVDQQSCYDVTNTQLVNIGGFKGGRCLTNQNSFFLCNQFNLLQLNLQNWVITLYSGNLSDFSTNPVCQLQSKDASITCIGYRDLPQTSLNGLSGVSKVCILGLNDNLNAVSCADNYCINQNDNNKCNIYNTSQMQTLYTQYGILGVSGIQRNCITQSQKVNSQNDCSHLYVNSVCFNPTDNTCWDLSKLNILDTSQPIGKFDIDGTCVFLGVYSNNQIKYCNQNINSVCLDSTANNQQGCFQWNTQQISQNNNQIIIGIFSDGTCAYKDVYDSKKINNCNTQNTGVCIYNSSLNNNLQGCISWNLSSIQQTTQPIGIFSDFSCAIQNIYTKQKIINCNFNINAICLDNTTQDNQACLNWNMSSLDSSIPNQAVGRFADNSCAFLNQYQNQEILNCNQQINNICLDNKNQNLQACINWQVAASSVINSPTQIIGIFNDYSCSYLNTYAQKAILFWNSQVTNVCLDNRDKANQAVFWWKDSSDPNPIGIFNDGSCAYLNTFVQNQIKDCSTINNVCKYNSSVNNNKQGCIQWNFTFSEQYIYPIGIYQDNTCAILNIYSNKPIQQCNYSVYGVCLDNNSQNNQACLNWNMSSLDSSISNQAVGIFTDNSCAFLNQYSNKQISNCNQQINTICLDNRNLSNQACLNWQLALSSVTNSPNQVIGIFNDYSCSFLNTYAQKAILQWNSQVSNVCLENKNQNNQAVFWWKDSSDPNPIGIFMDGSCAYLNIFVQNQIKDCNIQNNVCIYNSSINNNQQGCIQWNYYTSSSYPVGIYQDNTCAILNMYSNKPINQCNYSIYGVCLDNTSQNNQACLNWNLNQLDSSISNQAVGIYTDNSCAFQNNYQNKIIKNCNQQINTICLDNRNQSNQACLNWQIAASSVTNSATQVIGIFNDYSCSYLNTYAQKVILFWNSQATNVCLDNRDQHNQAAFWWKDQSDPNPIGIFQDGSCAYLNIFVQNQIKDCSTVNNVCIYNSSDNNSQQGCIQWNVKPSTQYIYPIGIYQDNTCAILNIYSNKPIKYCNYSVYGVCLDNTSQNNQACLNWNMGFLDSSNSNQAVGIFADNSCAFQNKYQNSIIKNCNQQIKTICLDNRNQSNQACLNWQLAVSSVTNSPEQVIGIFNDYSCSFLNTYAQKSILFWNSQVTNICLDNRDQSNQAAFWWKDQFDPNPIGIFKDGSCAYLNIFVQNQIKDCNIQNNVCIYNSSVNNNQQGCIQWNTTPSPQYIYPVGIFQDNTCAILNIYDNKPIQNCNYSVFGVCIDNTSQNNQACLNWNMNSLDSSITKQAVGIRTDNSCAFLDERSNKIIKQCNQQIKNVCLDDTQTNQACLIWQRPTSNVINSQTQVIGIFSDMKCAFLNTYASKQILFWNEQVNSVCIDNRKLKDEAVFWWDINTLNQLDQTKPIGRYVDGSCAYLNIFAQNQIKYCNQQIQFICLNNFDASYQGCSEWDVWPQTIQQNTNLIGKYIDGTCAFVGVYYNNQIQVCNFSVNFICQDTSSAVSQACVNYELQFNQIVGADNNNICLIENQPQAIKCSKLYCIDINQSCRILSSDATLNRIMTQKGTYQCFGNVGDTDTSKNAIWCAPGYCRKQRSNIDDSFYCKQLDNDESPCKDDGNHVCIREGGSSSQMIVDMVLSFCSAYINSSYLCVNSDTDLDYVIKDTRGQCQKFTDQQLKNCQNTTNCLSKITAMYCGCYNSLNSAYQCTFGPLCLDSLNNCVHVDYSELQGFPGRKQGTSTCQQKEVPQTVLCSKNYCLLNQECFEMTQNLYISQENKTQKCLLAEQAGQFGAKWCVSGFCKITNDLLKLEYCVEMEDSNTFALDKNGRCLSKSQSQNNSDLLSCQMNLFCLDNSETPKCIPIDPLNTCVDNNYKCISINSGSCTFCHITQCLSGDSCIPIQDGFCLGFNGKCIQSTGSVCKACNQNECYNPLQFSCTPFTKMNVKQDQCIIQVYNYMPCVYKQLNDNQYCAAYDNQCKELSTIPQCLRCPSSYLWVGNQKCYSSLMIECQLCSSVNNCLQCSFEYFLYADIVLQTQYCILLPSTQILYPDYLFEDKEFIQQNSNPQIAGIYNLYDYYINELNNNLEQVYAYCLNKWQFVKVGDIVFCDTFNIQYQFIYQKSYIPKLTIYYQIKLNQLNQIVLEQLSSFCNIKNCASCQILNNIKICLTCEYGYALSYLNSCQPCPDNCLSCFYGGYYNEQSVNWSQILANTQQWNIDFSKLSTTQYSILCSLCSPQFIVTKDYSGCEPCGIKCFSCYYGNIKYNLTSTFDIQLSQKYSTSIIKKCLQCFDGFIISPNMVDCIPISQDCLIEYFGKSDGSRQSLTSQNWWDSSLSYESKCYACYQFVSINYSRSSYQCNNKADPNYISNCQNTVRFSSENQPYCLQCGQNQSFNINLNICCYSYTDNANNQIFQCTQCLSQNDNIFLFPTLFGCQQCPEGCSSCYESEMVNDKIQQIELKNRTQQIIFEQIQPSLQDRLNIQSSDNYEIICSSCQVGYFLQNKRCIKNLCGPQCDLCYMKNFSPICISCSYVNLQKQISNISVQILSFYQLTDLNFKYMTHFNSLKQDCSLCPLGCLSCDYNPITNNPFSLYKSKCYSCKSIKQLATQSYNSNLINNYEWRLDQDTNSCVLCKNNQLKCAYRKETTIFAKCLGIFDELGSGTEQIPLNFQRANDADWDKLIVNESEFTKALVYMNELGVRELQVDIHILDQKCVLQNPISITTSLLQLIPYLQVFQINIIGNYTKDQNNPQVSEINIKDSISINGFLNNSQSIIISNVDTYSFQFTNCSINGLFNQFYDVQQIQSNNTKLYQGFFSDEVLSIQKFFFNIKIFNLRQTIQITNSSVNNLLVYQSSLFNFINTQASIQAQNISLQIENFNVSQVYFQQSSIISLSYQNITFQVNNIKISNNLMIQKSIMFQITPFDKLPNASLQISNLNFQRNQVYQNSQLLTITKLFYSLFEIITFDSNIIKNDKEFNSLIVINQMICLQLSVINNVLTKSYLFQNFDDGKLERQIYMKDQQYLFQFIQVLISNNTVQLIQSSIFYYIGNSTELNSLKFQGIVVNDKNQEDENLNSNLFSINSCYKVAIMNVNISHPNQINIFQISQAQYYTSRVINIVNNWIDQQLKTELFSIKQIYKGIKLQQVNIQNITTTSPLIFITNEFVSNQGYNSIIDINFLYANNNQIFIQQSTNIFSILAIKTSANQKISLSNLNFQNNTALFNQNQVVNDQQSACSCICIDAYQSYVNIIFSKFINNYSTASRNAISIISNNANLTECQFSNQMQRNINTSITLGGLVFSKSSRLSLNSCFLQQGFAQKGGAIYFQGQQYSQLIITQTQILQNRAALLESNSLGGGVYIDATSVSNIDIILENSEVSNNLATIQGGSFYITPFQGNLFFKMSDSIMQNNFALQGAFFYLNFNGIGIGRVFIISSSFYNDPSSQLQDLLQIIDQAKSQSNQFRSFSLFDFTQVTQLYIAGSIFESSQNQINLQNQNEKIYLFLYPALFNILQNIQYNEYNNTYQNFIVTSNFMNINAKNVQIVQSQYYNIQHNNFTSVNNIIFYNSNFVVIQNSSFSQLQCKFCQISPIQILVQQFQLQNSLFQQNQGSLIGGFLLIQQISLIEAKRQLQYEKNYQNKIENCIFQQNSAFNGGSLTIQFQQDFSTIVYGCQFIQNKAFNKGGVIYYQQLQQNQQININFIKNTFIKNSAYIGAIFYSNINQYMSLISEQNKVLQNQANYFGSLQITSPSQMQITYKQTLYQNNSKILVQTSGQLQNELLVFVLDEQGQQYKELEGDNLYLKVKKVSQSLNTFMEETNIPFKDGSFNLTNYLKIYGQVNEILSVQLLFDRIKSQQADNYNLVINFEFDKDCQRGYFKSKILSIYDSCLPCKNNSFSLIQNSQQCNLCPKIDGFVCYQETYLIPNGYWRRDNQSQNTLQCYNQLSNCIGDTQSQSIQRNQLNQLKIDKSSQEVYFCAEGHLGALCQDCDILGQYWKQKYYKIDEFKCQACSVARQSLHFKLFYIIAAITLNLILMYSCKKAYTDFILKKISLKLKASAEYKEVKISDNYIILKFVINYIQTIGLIYQINTSFFGSYFQIIRFLSNPLYGFVYLFDCWISDFYLQYFQVRDFYIFFRIIFVQVQLVILYCLTIIISTVFICFNKPWKTYLRSLINCFVIIIVLNISGIFSLILEYMFCTEVDGIFYLSRYTRIQCDEQFQYNLLIYIIPILIFWVLLVPSILILILKTKIIYLDQFQLKCKLGFIYHEYKKQYYYWEIVKIVFKMIIIAAISLTDNPGIQFGLSLASILSYKFILHITQPYQAIRSNQLDIMMINSIILCQLLVFASLQQDEISNFCFIVFFIVNLRVFLMIIKYQIKQLFLKILQKSYYRLQNHKKINYIIIKLFKNQINAKQMWKKLAIKINILIQRQQIGDIQQIKYQTDSLLQNTSKQIEIIYNFHKNCQIKQFQFLKSNKPLI